MSVVATELAISLELGHDSPCLDFAAPRYRQLAHGHYGLCSVMPLPVSLEEWRQEHKTARKRADLALRRGYRFIGPDPKLVERSDELYEINTSLPVRQGRPMSAGYLEKPSGSPDPDYPCEWHGAHRYGVEDADGRLRAYLWLYRCGELCLVSSILGHGDFLNDGIVYLVYQGMLASEPPDNGYVVYNRHDSGRDGLRWMKERLGLTETPVRWVP